MLYEKAYSFSFCNWQDLRKLGYGVVTKDNNSVGITPPGLSKQQGGTDSSRQQGKTFKLNSCSTSLSQAKVASSRAKSLCRCQVTSAAEPKGGEAAGMAPAQKVPANSLELEGRPGTPGSWDDPAALTGSPECCSHGLGPPRLVPGCSPSGRALCQPQAAGDSRATGWLCSRAAHSPPSSGEGANGSESLG